MSDLVIKKMTVSEIDVDGDIEFTMEGGDIDYWEYVNKDEAIEIVLHLMREFDIKQLSLETK